MFREIPKSVSNKRSRIHIAAYVVCSIILASGLFFGPNLKTEIAEAGFFDSISGLFGNSKVTAATHAQKQDLQDMPVLESTSGPYGPIGGPDIIVEADTLVSEASMGGDPSVYRPEAENISIYEVRAGDTVTDIAKMFGVSSNTIRWANDIKGTLKEGQILTILPVTGIRYTVKKGDTIASIAKLYKGDAEEIQKFNDITSGLIAGQVIIIPDAETPAPKTLAKGGGSVGTGKNVSGYFARPVKGGIRTQGVHGNNGVDLASYSGAPIYAAAPGEVIISRSSGWNGGYGNYVVIKHSNGTQTLYAHLNSVLVSAGTSVNQGDQVGTMGNTGKSTGIHLHFEVRGARNPF